MSNTSKGSEAPQLEILKLQNELEEVKEQRQKDKVEGENRIAEIQRQKDSVDAQYQSLLGRVTTIRTTLGERMKADAEELAQAKQTVEDLEEQNRSLNDTVDELSVELDKLRGEKNDASRELSSLRNRLNLAQQNWNKEREDLIKAERMTKEEYDVARQAMQDWEVIATEERAVRESLSDRVVELEEHLTTQKELYDRMATDYEKQGSSMEGLQRALHEIQDARKKELREIVENTQSQISALTTKCEMLDKLAKEAESNLTAAKQDLERVLPFEKEVKEKNLLIGKLRHEAVTLNDHLRKALRMLKRDNADDKIDKQLVTNVLLQFVSLQRGDAKKYEVLQLIASVLDWNDEQREKAGLLRPGTAAQHTGSGFFSSSLKTPPLTPFHRSPSTPALHDAYGGDEKDVRRPNSRSILPIY
ncbi:putative Golgi matrix protein [Trichophaea hybrida]|nr:putative Golgi matrix protein [Trichophaea hybrida]